MSLDWQYLGPQCAKSSVAALAMAAVIHVTTPVHFFAAAAVLLLAWPIADVIIESIASKNPNAGERVIVKAWWPVAFKWLVVAAASAGLWYWVHLPFMTAFAYALLVLASVGAINGIVIEWEDNAPGGWLNPK
jgi:hypothetical protein